MNPYTVRVICDVCGEKGIARPRDAANEWLGATLRHHDPEVCAENLKRLRLTLEKKAIHEPFLQGSS